MDDFERDERKTRWRVGLCVSAGFITAVVAFVAVVLINPFMPFSFWICLFCGYVGYRATLAATTPARRCSKCQGPVPKGEMVCPRCGKPVRIGLA